MTPAETRFKLIVAKLVRQGHHPTPIRVMRYLGVEFREYTEDETRWLREDLGVAMRPDYQMFCCRAGGGFVEGCEPLPPMERRNDSARTSGYGAV